MTERLLLIVMVFNIFTFFQMWRDKRKSQLGQWRTSETTLLLYGLLLGAPGLWLGMKIFRHKTLHPKFAYGIPALWVLNGVCIVGGYYLFRRFAG